MLVTKRTRKALFAAALLLLASTAGAQEREGRWSLTPYAGMTVATLVGCFSLMLGYRL
jgi:hypothetical protein